MIPFFVIALVAAAGPVAVASPQGIGRADSQPVRVWVEANEPIVPGAAVQVYVQTTVPGELIVIHRRTDGAIDVLFPTKPGEGPNTEAGTYEIQSRAGGAAFSAGEVGRGLVVAALTPGPMRSVQFADRAGVWDADALASVSAGADPEAGLTDAVQRMLGDETFDYDVAGYEVVPPAYAAQDSAAPFADATSYASSSACLGCSFLEFDGAAGRASPEVRRSGCEAASCGVVLQPALALYRGGRPNAASAPGAPLSLRAGAPSPRVRPLAIGSFRRTAQRAISPTLHPVSVAQPPTHAADIPASTGHLPRLPPVVIVQPRTRPEGSIDAGSVSSTASGLRGVETTAARREGFVGATATAGGGGRWFAAPASRAPLAAPRPSGPAPTAAGIAARHSPPLRAAATRRH